MGKSAEASSEIEASFGRTGQFDIVFSVTAGCMNA